MMRACIFLFSLLLCPAVKGQDNADCYNDGGSAMVTAMSSYAEESPVATTQNSLILMPGVMKEKEVLLIIKEKNNTELNRLLKKISLAKTFQNIGFAAIPEALIGGGLIGAAAASNSGSVQQRTVGAGLLALSAVCLSSSLCFKIQRTKNYKKAIQKYNQLYN